MLYFYPRTAAQTAALAPIRRPRREAWLSALTVLCLYAALAVRTPLSGSLDGLPWNSPAEFVLAACALPLAVLLNPRFFARKPVILISGLLLACRVLGSLYFPQTGLEVQLVRGETIPVQAPVTRSYASLLDPGLTELLRAPYQNPREFPIEWINSPAESLDTFWITLNFNGYLRLERGQRLVISAQGLTGGQAEIVNLATGETLPVQVTAPGSQPGPAEASPEPGQYHLQGSLVFKHYDKQQFDLLLAAPDGSLSPALAGERIWRTAAGLQLSQRLLNLLADFDLLTLAWLVGLAALAGLDGLRRLYWAGTIQPVDLFLAGSIAFFVLAAAGWQRKDYEGFIPLVVAGLGLVRLAFFAKTPDRRPNGHQFLVAIGIPLLVMFLCLDAGDLRSAAVFPQGQDNIEYQTLARNIFVDGDSLLLNHSARAYKILFPYLVGTEHLLFGQSVAAQLFMNAWCALLSMLLLAGLARAVFKPGAGQFLLPLCGLLILTLPSFYLFYFRFGLMEPAAVLLVLATLWLASRNSWAGMALTGMLAVLMRLDYIGIVFAAALLTCAPLSGGLAENLHSLRAWLSASWQKLAGYGLALILPPALILLAYYRLIPGYILNASDTQATSLASVLEGLTRIIMGGSLDELQARFAASPPDMLLISVPLVLGTLLGLLSLLRLSPLKKIDPRWGLLMVAFLLVYIVVLPTGYSPRFSTPLLPLALLVIHQSLLVWGGRLET